MKGIILYQSKYGATKKYVDWLKEETRFDVEESKKADIKLVKDYDFIILAGGIYASGLAGLPFLKRHIDDLSDKKIIVLAVGATPHADDVVNYMTTHNLKDKLAGIPLVYARGAWDLSSMNFIDRNLCKLLLKSVQKKDPEQLEMWEQALVAAGDNKGDWTDKKYLEPIYEFIKKNS